MSNDGSPPSPDRRGLIAFAWLWVGASFAYSVHEPVKKETQLFNE